MDEARELIPQIQQALEELQAAGQVEVHEDGRPLPGLAGMQYELRQQGQGVFLHVWSEDANLARRVLRIAEQGSGRLVLEVRRFGRAKPGTLEFFVAERARTPVRLAREKFLARMGVLLAEKFPDEEVESLTCAPDLEHSFSGAYVRGVTRRGQRAWAVAAAAPGEDAATVDAILTTALLWIDWLRETRHKGVLAGLRLFLPEGGSAVTAHRLQALAPAAPVELFELDASGHEAHQLDPRDIGNLATRLTPRREVEETLAAARESIDELRSLSPDEIDAVVPPGAREVAFRFRGLEFARWKHGAVWFGAGEEKRALKPATQGELRELVESLQKYRRADSPDTNHLFYRAQAERWLETLVLADAAQLDARLDPRHIYPQVPAFSAGDRGIIDLLGVTRDGRLAVIELKVSEDPNLVLQAVDYWLRVNWHQKQDDFRRYGYFPAVELQERPPLLYLAAPGLRFHPAAEIVLRHLSPGIDVQRVGLNEQWRAGLQVIFRQ
jgi:hypothetical protein